MRKRLLAIMLTLLFAVSVFALASCGGGGGDTPAPDNRPEIDGVTFNGATYTYDGTEKSIEVSGLPEGATVTYTTSNKATNAGSYAVNATVKLEGHKDLTVTATLVIEPKEIDIEWGDLGPFASVGEEPEIEYTVIGALDGDEVNANISFGDCDFTEAGEFTFTVTLDNSNYKLKAEDKSVDFEVGGSEHKVTFDAGDGKEPDVEEVEHNDTVDKPRRDPIKLGYEFLGWYLGEEPWDFDTPVTKNMTLTAKWKANVYNIYYYLDGGENSSENPTEFSFDKGFTLKAPKKNGYVFAGWYKDAALTQPAVSAEPETLRASVSYYAKWESGYTEVPVTDNSAIGHASMINGKFTYTFSANISSFAEDGAIYIGRGLNALGGSYVKLTENQIAVYTNSKGGEILTEKNHTRSISGYLYLSVAVAADGTATLTIITADGQSVFTGVDFMGNNGEIFYKSENTVLRNESFGYISGAKDEKLWIVGDNVFGKESWTSKIAERMYASFATVTSPESDIAEVFEALKSELAIHSPKYIVWSFAGGTDKFSEITAEFISLCKEKSIVPILVTLPECENNSFVTSAGERYIDLASFADDCSVYENGKYTVFGFDAVAAKALVDFPEMLSPENPIKSLDREVINSSNSTASLGNNRIKDEKYYVLSAKIDGELGEGAKISLNHGYMTSYGRWLEITDDEVRVMSYTSWSDPQISERVYNHGLTIKNYITVILAADSVNSNQRLIIITDGGMYTVGASAWTACEGEISVSVEGAELTDVSLDFACKAYSKDIWIIGASYLSLGDPARWPYYYYQEGFADALLVGRGGMGAQHGIVDFEDALKHGTPKILVWDSVSGNNPDKAADVDPTFLTNTLKMLQICKEKGIKVYIQTMPNCPNQTNWYKNDAILNRLGEFAKYDYEVIDIARSVGARDELNPSWYENMIHSDNVHPITMGARACYLQMLCDMPELVFGKANDVLKAEAAVLANGNKLTVQPAYPLKNEKIITFRADFSGPLSGSIIIGNTSTEGATYLEIDKNNVRIYRIINGSATLILTEENIYKTEELINVRIYVDGYKASIAMMSVGEKNYDASTKKLHTIETEWTFAGDISVSATEADLSDAILRFSTAD